MSQLDHSDSIDTTESQSLNFSALTRMSSTPRYVAAIVDNLMVIILAVPAAKYIGNSAALQLSVSVVVFIAYHFIPELLIGQTLGKLITRISVVQANGQKCTARQALVRSIFRLFEANPIIGGLPAVIFILSSQTRQRLGDRFAGTYVIPKEYVQ